MLEIVTFPNEILKRKTNPVKSIDAEIKEIIKEMKETMYKNDGIGLAANQVNIPLSIMVIDTTSREDDQEKFKDVLINPTVLAKEGEIKFKEGCLSFPGLQVEVVRAKEITIKAINEREEEVILNLSGLPAIVFQHEFDHLNGITFLDRLSGIKKRLALEKYQKMLKEKVSA
ncbi:MULTISPECIES: peptide deformylase [unclassified Hydrogenobaculum]|jgi:peptide deformylase (EC 3.5.1.88)|uniref:peptide deformylase n=1 Tax=unclassified Hydrogenobaculum TaxID=2622382 RepID=UPI0001C51C3E|nr:MULTISPECIES: peptide deformylase [unclassified Hydrogenobaculum]AEF19840.1 peptide deformylase [Hydrogenobaculum sp. 3684]AEG47126.1 Peptide deformylase [Hydrogenobaculum sp. SHO]AGG15774.1 peptide deformylase [Hydrogenobaculum sp. HO]AGH94074.1 peptide deformylase [Hydrogenobaculum sp. SN]